MKRWFVLCLLASLAGCASRPVERTADTAPERPAVVIPPPSATASATPAPTASSDADTPAPVASPAFPPELPAAAPRVHRPACRYASDDFNRSRLRPSLKLTPDAEPWGKLMRAERTRGSVTIASGSDQRAVWFDIDTRGVELGAWAVKAHFPLYATRTLLLGGVVAPRPRTALDWWKGRKGYLSVRYPLTKEPFARDVVVDDEVACTALAPERGKFDPRDDLSKGATKMLALPLDTPVPLRARPTLAPVAELRAPTKVWTYVTEIEQQGAFSRILLSNRSDAVIVGWVPSTTLAVPSGGGGNDWGIASDRGGVRRRPRKPLHPLVRCDAQLPFAVDFKGKRAAVGWIKPGVHIEVYPNPDVLQRIGPRDLPLYLFKGAELYAVTSALAKCTPVATP
jgi:hypothetical protein